ncbi:MAG: hypothetical protein ACMG6E_04575, partial [Candidatus Roizmanbacteria bacterium]
MEQKMSNPLLLDGASIVATVKGGQTEADATALHIVQTKLDKLTQDEDETGPENILIEEYRDKAFLTYDDFNTLLVNAKVDSFHKRGTYGPSKAGQVYVYVKRNFICPNFEAAQVKLGFCKDLTANGAVFPGTRWGIFQRKSGQFHVFAITRELELEPPSGDPLRNSRILQERLGPDYANTIDVGEANRNPMGHLPNSTELYPVDIEVLALSFNEEEAL